MGLSPATLPGTRREITAGKKFYDMTSDSNTVVEYLLNHPKVVGLSLAAIAGTRRKWCGIKLQVPVAQW